jgi:RimJ/RimL family protein N-acetyltransferase
VEHAMMQLVEALHYKLEGCRFDSWWCHWNFSLT